MENTYHEELLELYRHPLNKKTLANPTFHHREHNPLCGDIIELFVLIKDDRIVDIGFQGNGCVLSDVGASLMTETVKGKPIAEATAITTDTMLEILGIKNLNPTRIRCTTLALEGLKKMFALADLDNKARAG